MSVVASQSRLEEADSTLFESNEDLYAIFKALQSQEEFLDIQVPKITNIYISATIFRILYYFRKNMLKMKCEISSES